MRGADRAQIVGYDNLVIYLTPSGKGRATAFSDNLDSEVILLNSSNLKEHFKNNKPFLDLLNKDALTNSFWNNGITETGRNGRYRILDIYNKSLEINSKNRE